MQQNRERFPPSEYIFEELSHRNMSVESFAKKMQISMEHADLLLSGELPISLEITKRLAKLFDTSEILWTNLENEYRGK